SRPLASRSGSHAHHCGEGVTRRARLVRARRPWYRRRRRGGGSRRGRGTRRQRGRDMRRRTGTAKRRGERAPRCVATLIGLTIMGGCAAGPEAPEEDPLVERGREIFFNETFAGNGRTCATCHR